MARITFEQSLSRLQPQGKRKAKGKSLELVESINDNVFVVGSPNGGFVTPADDELPAILGAWEGETDLPPGLQDLLGDYADEVGWWQRIGHALDADEGAASGRESIPAMTKTKWAQGSPFNSNLTFEGKQCLVGCGAVAISQILHYWYTRGYCRGCKPTKKYKTRTNLYNVDALPALTVFDYADLTEGKPTTKASINAVATMLEYVGKALQSDYAVGGTSVWTSDIVPVLRDYLRMGKGVKEINSAYTTAKNFEATIYGELVNRCPVILFGTGERGGHFFVCDGYDAVYDLYRINWGWGGSCDGYYALSALTPGVKAYNTRKRAYVGIKPEYILGDVNGDGAIDISDAMQVIQAIQKGDDDVRYDINSDGKVTITDAQLIIDKILGRNDL